MSSVYAEFNPICSWMPDVDDVSSIYGPDVKAIFTPQSSPNTYGDILQSAFIADTVDTLGIHRSMEFSSVTSFRDDPTTIITLHEKVLPFNPNPRDSVGFPKIKIAITDEFGTMFWRANNMNVVSDYICDLVIDARRNLKSVAIAIDEVRTSDDCLVPTPADLQKGKWGEPLIANFKLPVTTDKSTPNELTRSGGDTVIPDKEVHYSTVSRMTPGQSNIAFRVQQIQAEVMNPMSRTLATMTLADSAKTKVQYILPGGPKQQYICHGIYAMTDVLVASMTLQSENTGTN